MKKWWFLWFFSKTKGKFVNNNEIILLIDYSVIKDSLVLLFVVSIWLLWVLFIICIIKQKFLMKFLIFLISTWKTESNNNKTIHMKIIKSFMNDFRDFCLLHRFQKKNYAKGVFLSPSTKNIDSNGIYTIYHYLIISYIISFIHQVSYIILNITLNMNFLNSTVILLWRDGARELLAEELASLLYFDIYAIRSVWAQITI